MHHRFTALSTLFLTVIFCAQSAAAQPVDMDAGPIEIKFEILQDLGNVQKPTVSIQDAKSALNFIMADSIVRRGIFDAMRQGYDGWKATATRLGYDGNEPIWQVRIGASNKLPPYACIFRFDSIGNDRRDRPENGCQYE